MVFERTLAGVLKRQLSQWVNIRESDVGVGISGGHLVMDNVELRADSLNALALPFKVISGQVGRLRVDVPWSALSSSPVVVYLEDVHMIAGRISSSKSAKKSSSSGRLSEQESEGSAKNADGRDEQSTPDGRRKRRGGEPGSLTPNMQPLAPSVAEAEDDGEDRELWHKNIAFRLAANVSLEINGFKLEYTDRRCHISMSLTALRTTACDAGWEPAFVPLDDSSGAPLAIRRALEVECLQFQMLPKQTDVRPTQDFESLFPILSGLNARLQLFMCTGGDGEFADAQSCHLEIDLEEPGISISARQLKWLQRIFGQSDTKAPRGAEGQLTRNSSDLNVKHKSSRAARAALPRRTSNTGSLGRLWSYIVGENGYTLDEDAAGLLGLDGADNENGGIVDDPFVLEEMLQQAGTAGGFTWTVTLRTPDVKARQELKKTKQQLKEERKFREQFKDVETLVADAETRVRDANGEVLALRERNQALQAELADLEKLVAEQNRSKDAIIRQMESALAKAERQMQTLLHREATSASPRPNVLATPGSSPASRTKFASPRKEPGALTSPHPSPATNLEASPYQNGIKRGALEAGGLQFV